MDVTHTQPLQARTHTILKAVVAGARADDTPDSQAMGEESAVAFATAGALEPPYDPEALCLLLEHSNALRQSVDAYATNIDGFGHRFEPTLDLDAQDVRAQVCACRQSEDPLAEPLSDDEAATYLKDLRQAVQMERARLEAFFEFCCAEHSFVDLRRRTRQDLEITGNAFWEVLRNGRGEVARLVYVPAHSVRLMPLDAQPVEVQEVVRTSKIHLETLTTRRRMRRYVQVCGGVQVVFFKNFGDPRLISRKTGAESPTFEDLQAADPSDGAATELIHFAIHSPRTPYGVPRWMGALLSVLGSRQMEEVNYLYFENKSVPPLALLVSGGRLSEASVPRIERFIDEHLKGKKNFHKILILEAETGAGASDTAKAKIELKPLTDAQQQDALFQRYDEHNIDKVGSAFRLPKLLRGESKDFNRATAESALRFAEDQVFQPERDEFDFLINRRLLADMGVRFWRFRSQTPVTRDPERMTQMVIGLVNAGVLTPDEARQLAGDIFNREFPKISEDWVRRPIALTLAGVHPLTTTKSANDDDGETDDAA
jgi:PBSX family phage portal protein